jgi:hypothetical protein
MATKTSAVVGFHLNNDVLSYRKYGWVDYKQEAKFTYTFANFFHPYVGELIQRLNQRSLPGLFDPKFHKDLSKPFFTDFYTEHTGQLVGIETFNKEIDVDPHGPYANYNWELLFHIPLAIAVHLSKNRRFAEAQRWFHFIFDPTANDPSVAPPGRYWRFIAFQDGAAGRQIDELLALLSKPASDCTAGELLLKAAILDSYQASRNKPFMPHAVARTRQLAYMYSVVMKYLDNLIAWGDSLFRQDTIESINEATQIYVLAANILGARPERVPIDGTVRSKTFAQLRTLEMDALGNALVELEGEFPFNFGLPSGTSPADEAAPLFGIGRTLYFCVPRNDRLLAYWDDVADRLFKIRHCQNIEGVVRPLALFDPPLDPGMLVKAAAAGIDIGAIVAGLNQPVSPVRAPLLIQKALELAGEVRGLGAALLGALEKGDGEQLALLRQGHEIRANELQREVRFLQWKQAQEATEGLIKSREITLERYRSYLRLLGGTPDATLAPDNPGIDRSPITEENFDEVFGALVERYAKEVPLTAYPALRLAAAGPAVDAGATGLGKLALTTTENDELHNLVVARDTGLAASIVNATATALTPIPDAKGNLHYWGLGGTIDIKVGTAIVKAVEIAAKILEMTSAWHREQAGIDQRTGAFERRVDDWVQQVNLAGRELRHMGRQLIASRIAEQIAEREYTNVIEQIEHSHEVDRFLHDKFTNNELYGWMAGEYSRVFYETYRFGFDVARLAEQTAKADVMRPEFDQLPGIQFNYWDAGRKGLLSGESLYLDVKRLEMAYHEHNRREYELTKHVSLQQVDPFALVRLRATGRCTVHLPEGLFDLDGPGQYFRRIKSVALSIPCVTGPYTGVNCKLTLVSSSIRVSADADDPYERDGLEDTRFKDSFGAIQSIVASSGQQDSGLFETNLHDERYLPFENAGVISEWQLELPGNPSEDDPTTFDYDTIADVVFDVRYTARDGGAQLRGNAVEAVKALIDAGSAAGSVRLFSMRHEFPTEWARFTSQDPGPNRRRELALTLRQEHYPFWSQGRLNAVARIDLFAASAADPTPATIQVSDRADTTDATSLTDTLTRDASLQNLLAGRISNVPLPAEPTGDLALYFEDANLDDLLIALSWSG